MTQREAVYSAVEQLGDQTSLNVLAELASKIYGGPIGISACSTFRGEWRLANGSDTDCRTYDGQPERNMLKGQVKSQQGRALAAFVKRTNVPLNQLEKLLDAFSGLDQLRQTSKQLGQFMELEKLFKAA